jgi:hypothetical protein
MKKIPVASAGAGMRLVKPITNELGITLFGKGVVLTDQFIDRIRSMNIPFIFVEGQSAPARSLSEELSMLDWRFRKTENEPYMGALKETLKEYLQMLYRDAEEREASTQESPPK